MKRRGFLEMLMGVPVVGAWAAMALAAKGEGRLLDYEWRTPEGGIVETGSFRLEHDVAHRQHVDFRRVWRFLEETEAHPEKSWRQIRDELGGQQGLLAEQDQE